MRIDIHPIIDRADSLLRCIEAKDVDWGWQAAGALLESLPPDELFDPEPGVTICTSIPEYGFRQVLPYLRGTVRKWHGWLGEADRDAAEWPEPTRLREVLAVLGEIRGQLGEPSTCA